VFTRSGEERKEEKLEKNKICWDELISKNLEKEIKIDLFWQFLIFLNFNLSFAWK